MKEKQLCILVVDSALDTLESVKLSLETQTKWRVFTCSSSLEAVLQAQKEIPDIIFLNIQMPDMNGIDTAKRLRVCPKTKTTPIVLLIDSPLLMTDSPVRISSKIFHELNIIKIIRKPSNALNLASSIRLSLQSLNLKVEN